MTTRTYDVVLFGATGFTGKLVAEYIATRDREKEAAKKLRWAIAGRNKEKLEAVKRDLVAIDPDLAGLPVVVADGLDEASLDALVPQTSVVCTTVGPFAQYGKKLVASCAKFGTHYCDITGETPFIREMIDQHHERAKEMRARIVHCCGFDSIPFDLGVHMLWHRASEKGTKLSWVKGFAGEMKGTFSGGTVASMIGILDAMKKDPSIRKVLGNPYALDPDPKRGGPDGPDQRSVKFDEDIGRWTGPFVMAAVNTRIVRRSNALLDRAYGPSFRYAESQTFPNMLTATMMTAGLGAFAAGMMVDPVKKLLQKKLPKPGEGPTKEQRDSGFFKVRLVGETEPDASAKRYRLKGLVEGTSDPGYGETAKMLAESAMCLALDQASLDARFGILTPATAMGMVLVERLRRAGMTFRVEEA
ncbi:MAG: saccharopine dehydrogenase NADP-binding domain-containing protein [Deltaproteobacteria bacterium]|nr:saccharopine dehydrogenase NADP-binding domain-containing protein [Deltaproteobacteria bacterium]